MTLNGDIVSSSKTGISPYDRGFLLGDGLFETFYYNGVSLENEHAHWARLKRGVDLFHIPLPFSIETLHQQIMELLKANGLDQHPASVRLTLTRGESMERGVRIPSLPPSPTWVIQVCAYHRSPVALTLGLSKHIHPGASALSSVKHLGYQLSILGRLEAQQKNVDDVLFMNQKGEVVSTTTGNIFALFEDKIMTPPLSSGCLPGTKRGEIIEKLKKKGFPFQESPLLWQDVFQSATSLFITNSLLHIQHVRCLEKRILRQNEMLF